MKKLPLVLFSLLLIGFAGPAAAAKNAKQVLHCGCVYSSLDGVSMVFHEISIAGNSQGHRNHVIDSEDLCFAGLDDNLDATYEPWERDADDCMISGTNDGLVACVDQQELDPCGSPVEIP